MFVKLFIHDHINITSLSITGTLIINEVFLVVKIIYAKNISGQFRIGEPRLLKINFVETV